MQQRSADFSTNEALC